MKYDIQFTNQFKKDLKLAKKQNRSLDKLFEVILSCLRDKCKYKRAAKDALSR